MINYTRYLAVMRSGKPGLGRLALGLALCLVGSVTVAGEFPPDAGIDKFESRGAFKIVFTNGTETPPFTLTERGTVNGLNTLDRNGDGLIDSADAIDFNGDGIPDNINNSPALLVGTCHVPPIPGTTGLCFGGVRNGLACTQDDENPITGCPDYQPGKTFIGRSAPRTQSDPPDGIPTTLKTPFPPPAEDIPFLVGTTAPSCLYRYPKGFPAPTLPLTTPDRRMVDTEILHLELVDNPTATTPHIVLRAGDPFKRRADFLGITGIYENSFGEVVSFYPGTPPDHSKDFPAASVFNVFAMIEINSPQIFLVNLEPMVLFLVQIQNFPPFLHFPTGVYIHDPNFPPVPLFDQFGLLRGWLVSAGHGSPTAGQLLSTVRIQVTLNLNIVINFLVPGTRGLPVDLGNPPNDVRTDAEVGNPALPLTVYHTVPTNSNVDPLAEPPLDRPNLRLSPFVGSIGGPDGFVAGDAMSDFSFGRDGTVNPTTHIKTPGTLFFSATKSSIGEGPNCTASPSSDLFFDQRYGHPDLQFARGGASLYAAAMPPDGFGIHTDIVVPFPSKQLKHFHVLSSDALGLAFDQGSGKPQDDMTGLEIGARQPDDNLYATFKGPSFTDNTDPLKNNTASIFIFDPAAGPFNKSNLKRYARAQHLGLDPLDKIAALVLSDATSPTHLYCNQVVSHIGNQSAASEAAGNQPDDVLAAPDAATIGTTPPFGTAQFNNDGVNPGEVVCSFTGRPIINGPGSDLKIYAFAELDVGVCDVGGTNTCSGGLRNGLACAQNDENPVTGCPDLDQSYEVLASDDNNCNSGFISLGIASAPSTMSEFDLKGLTEARCVKIRNVTATDLVDYEGPRIDAVEALNFVPPEQVDVANGNRNPDVDEVLFTLDCSSSPKSPSCTNGVSGADIFYSKFDGSHSLFRSHDQLGLLPTDGIDAADVLPDPGNLDPTQLHLVGPVTTDPTGANQVKACDPVTNVCDLAKMNLAVQAGATGVPDRSVVLTVVRGNLTLFDPSTGIPSNQLTLPTSNSGDVTVALQATAAITNPDWGVIRVTVPGTTLQSFAVVRIVP